MLEGRGAVASITSSKIGQEKVFNGWNTFIQLRCGLESITNDRKCVVFVGKLWTSENNRRKSLERKMAALEQCYFYRHLSMFVDVCVAQWWAERGIWVHGWDGIYQQQMHEHAQPISNPPPSSLFHSWILGFKFFHQTTHFCAHRMVQTSLTTRRYGWHACRSKSQVYRNLI